ncbi:hypothetical protein AN216_07790 [Streptomyces oceani]|uniref:Glycoside hydrolase family 95 protein n=1 Tax=Streptomyces oceani TaxID=1075402 RepID=A0A1E7KK95_9ACTN|nr:hypothetical protein AN216_07790 [Streptomyces oceani]
MPGGASSAYAAARGAPAAAGTAGADWARLYYESPARTEKILMEGLPLGNGNLGALVGGDVAGDVLALNEDTLWTGGTNPSGDYGGDENMGNYQALARLTVRLDHDPVQASDYYRQLDVQDALAVTSYTTLGTGYRRRAFASHPDQVLVYSLTADQPGRHSGSVQLADGGQRTGATLQAAAGHLSLRNSLSSQRQYAVHVAVRAEGGSVRVSEGRLRFTSCTALTLVIAAGTDYVPDLDLNYRSGQDPLPAARERATAAAARTVPELLRRHQADYRKLFDRLTLELGSSSEEQLGTPTFQRVKANQRTLDPELFTLYFQFARYLMISASRAGAQPINLQGIWNIVNDPPWSSDYHTDINVQMCYWLADQANLAETSEPLFAMLEAQVPSWRRLTRDTVRRPADGEPVRGWTVRTSHNIDGGMGWEWVGTGNAWYCMHLWDHYLYTLDRDFLRDRAYPLLRETCQYLEDILVDDGRGALVVPDGWSPEQAPGPYWRRTPIGFDFHGMVREDGVSFDQELAWDVCTRFLAAAHVLDSDEEYQDTVRGLRDRLRLPRIGGWGQLQEWYDDKDSRDNTHRHISHLVGFYPGNRISPHTDRELTEAVRTSLTARGVGPTGWSAAWGAACWARLGDSAMAMKHLRNLLAPVESSRDDIDMDGGGGVYTNLFDAHPPFQIDGNIGGASAMLGMLVQSEAERIDLLPALPEEWPTGSLRGVRARGGFALEVEWEDGALRRAVVESTGGTSTTVHYGSASWPVRLRPGDRREIRP